MTAWIGLAGEAFREALEQFPTQLQRLCDSSTQAAGALGSYAAALDSAQDTADRALAQGRLARAEIDTLSVQLGTAAAAASNRTKPSSTTPCSPTAATGPSWTRPAASWSPGPH